jgi:N,N'-diacetyllegionaminate synthase
MVDGLHGEIMSIKISNKYIGKLFPTYFIAEAGLNHNGDINLAKKMIDEAKNANSDAIKFQTYKSENFLTKNSKYFDFFKNVELSFEEFKEIKEYADNVGITFLSTPFDFESADYLQKINVSGFKIASSDITNLPLITHVAKMKLPIILSTGLSTLDEIDEAIKSCTSLQNDQISILHCVADYPAIPEETNLSAMDTIREKFNFPVGYSDNGESSLVDEVAVSMGANIIEKHFTLDKKLEGPDHSFSIQPNDLKLLISRIRLIEKIRGNGIKIPTNSEIKNKIAIRKSIFASQHITKGDIFSSKNLAIKRPGDGIEPKYWNDIIDKKSTKDINKDELITWGDFSK